MKHKKVSGKLGNLLGASAIVAVAQIRLVTFAMFVNLIAFRTDAFVAAVRIATLQAAANVFILRAFVEIIAHLLVIRQL